MTRTRVDRAKIATITVRYWWNTRGWWTQIMIAAALLCVFELLVIWAVRPHLLQAVAS